jgi:ferrous iron transport protein A
MNEFTETPSIAQLQTGEKARLLDNHFGRGDTSRMASFGLTPGVTITVVQNYGRGPMIVRVRGSHIALGRIQANSLLVQRMPE